VNCAAAEDNQMKKLLKMTLLALADARHGAGSAAVFLSGTGRKRAG
jgi:hypothetical protein